MIVKSLLLFFCSLCLCIPVFGQLLVGPRIAPHIGKVEYEKRSFRESFDPGFQAGGSVGAAVTFPVKEPFSLHAELLYSIKGKVVSLPEDALKNKARYQYIELPIMMRVNVWPEKNIYLGIGPNLSYWIGGSGKIDDLESPDGFTKYKVNFRSSASPDDLHISDPNRLQLGLLFGLGKQFKLQDDRRLTFELRYEMGHSFLGKADDAYLDTLDFTDNLESKHQILSVNVGYFWVLHKKSKRKKSSTYRAKQRKH